MRFHSLLYVLFLVIAVIVAWAFPRKHRKAFLLATSYVFYASWHIKYVVLLFTVGAIASFGGRFIDEVAEPKARRRRGTGVVLLLAAILGAFKYLDWTLENLNALFVAAGGAALPLPHWLLPLGVSFYTFEAIGYIVEVTRKKEKRYAFFDFQLFLSFFPHLVAGPIMRAKELIPQFDDVKWRPRLDQVLRGIENLAIGLFIKNVIVDKFSWEVDAAFAQPLENVGTRDVFSMSVGFAVQIYLDFSAYSRLAIGSGQLFGIELVDNFNFPFRARTPADFWNRWHISLSRWIRDYLFFPLVGKRMRVWRMCLASVISMVICGLWHGAGFTFLLWGAYHGALVALYYVARWGLSQLAKRGWEGVDAFFDGPVGGLVSAGITWILLLPTWILFRATTVSQALHLIHVLVTPWAHWAHGGGVAKKPIALMVAIWMAPFVADAIAALRKRSITARPLPVAVARGMFVGVALVVALLCMGSQTAFVYFQF